MESRSKVWFVVGSFFVVVIVSAVLTFLLQRSQRTSSNLNSSSSSSPSIDSFRVAPVVKGPSITLYEAVGNRKLFFSKTSFGKGQKFFLVDGNVLVTTEYIFDKSATVGFLSPDGQHFAYAIGSGSTERPEVEIRVRTLQSNVDRILKRGTFEELQLLQWTPDSKKLVFARSELELGSSLHTLNVETAQQEALVDKTQFPELKPLVVGFGTIAFSPDGQFLYVAVGNDPDGPPTGTLYRINTKTKKVELLIELSSKYVWTGIVHDAWFPDRTKVILGSVQEGGPVIYDLASGGATPFPKGDGDYPYSPISPNGQYMLVIRNEGQPDYDSGFAVVDLVLVNLRTGAEENVASAYRTRMGILSHPMIWSPDSTFLLLTLDGLTYRFDVDSKGLKQVYNENLNAELSDFVQIHGWVNGSND